MNAERLTIDNGDAARSELPEALSKPPWLQQNHSLPFNDLSPDEFEVLCFLLLLQEHPGDRVIYYGKTADMGRDIVHITQDGRVRFVQCKRYTNRVGRDEILAELAKLASNLFLDRYPHRPDEVVWCIVPDLTNPAADLLEDQAAWKADALRALTKHLKSKPSSELVAFSESWWPDFDQHHALVLTERLRRHPDLIEQFFSVQHVVMGDAESVAQATADKVMAALPNLLLASPHRFRPALPTVEDGAFDAAEALAALPGASQSLLSWPQTVGNDVWIERDELGELERRLGDAESSATLLLGPPGSGKSAFLARLSRRLIDREEVVLAIKADKLPRYIDSEARLSEHLRLPALLTSCVEMLAKTRRVYVILDQLDALGDFVDLKSQRLEVLLGVIGAVSNLAQVHVVASCREFEYRHDARLTSIAGEPLRLELPLWSTVEPVLKAHEFDPTAAPERLRDLLRCPQHLKIFIDRKAHGDLPQECWTPQGLLEDLWDRVLVSPSNADERLRLVAYMAGAMADREELWLPLAEFDASRPIVNQLVADGLLQVDETRRRIGFRHQTYFEHARARDFLSDPDGLVSYVWDRQNALFVRPVLWGALHYLRSASQSHYERALQALTSRDFRPHVQFLLIEFLGVCESVTDLEQIILQSWLDKPQFHRRVVVTIAGNSSWFERLVDTHLRVWMSEPPAECWPALNFLIRARPFARERCLTEVRKRWLTDTERDGLTLSFLEHLDSWNEETVEDLCRILRRRDLDEYLPMHYANEVAASRPDLAPKIIRTTLERRLAATDSEVAAAAGADDDDEDSLTFPDSRYAKLLDERTGLWEMPELAAEAPRHFLEELWPWFVQVLDRAIRRPHHVMRMYREGFSLAFDLEGDHFANNPVMRSFDAAVRELAATDAAGFDAFLAQWQTKDAAVVQKLLCRGVMIRSETDPDIGVRFLCDDPRRLFLGGHEDNFSDSRALLTVLGRTSSDEAISQLVEAILQWSAYLDEPALDDPSTRFHRRKYDRGYRLRLLRSLPADRLPAGVKALISAEIVALPEYRERDSTIEPMRCYGARMTAERMGRASDAAIVRFFLLLSQPDKRQRWPHRPEVDTELAAIEFGKLAKTQARRVARMLPQMAAQDFAQPVALAVEGLGESEELTTAELFTLVEQLEERGHRGHEFRSHAADAFAARANREAGLSAPITETLERWLDEWTAYDTASSYDDRQPDKEDLSQSLLWGHFGGYTLPRGSYRILIALAYGYVRRESFDYDRWLTTVERHLKRPELAYVWKVLTRELTYLRFAEDKQRAGLAVASLLTRRPDVRCSEFGMHILAWCRFLLEDDRFVPLLESYRHGGWSLGAFAYGELLGLTYLFGERDSWAQAATENALDLPHQTEEAQKIWTGLAHSLAHLYDEAEPDGRASALFEALASKLCDSCAAVLMHVFVTDKSLPANGETKQLLRCLAGNPRLLQNASHDWLIDKLLDLVAFCPELVNQVCMSYLEANAPVQLSPGSPVYSTGPHLIDISLRLQRLGGELRASGMALFEKLLELGLADAEATLVEIDGRLRRAGTPPPRRRRRKRA